MEYFYGVWSSQGLEDYVFPEADCSGAPKPHAALMESQDEVPLTHPGLKRLQELRALEPRVPAGSQARCSR
eukprot:12663791-Alexandrium_andersonii.AAC.1